MIELYLGLEYKRYKKMPSQSRPRVNLLDHVDAKIFTRLCVGCLVLNKDGKIVLQQRDDHCQTYPGRLATFGGGIEFNETPIQALIRELKEELGAEVNVRDVISLGIITEAETNYRELVYVYFWHDKNGTITGCYEGKAKYYNTSNEAENHPKIMEDVRWLLQECKKRKFLL
jgi:8-oxo-dGTP diphosphatase